MAKVSVLGTLGKGVSVSIASGATSFARSCQVAEELATACLAGAVALEQWASSSLSANNLKKFNDMIERTTVTVVEETTESTESTEQTQTTTPTK